MEKKEANQFNDIETYCIAKIFQSVLFSEAFIGETDIFYGCKHCKYSSDCMPDNKPHKDMIFDRVRKKLQKLTAVDLDKFIKTNKFKDDYHC